MLMLRCVRDKHQQIRYTENSHRLTHRIDRIKRIVQLNKKPAISPQLINQFNSSACMHPKRLMIREARRDPNRSELIIFPYCQCKWSASDRQHQTKKEVTTLFYWFDQQSEVRGIRSDPLSSCKSHTAKRFSSLGVGRVCSINLFMNCFFPI